MIGIGTIVRPSLPCWRHLVGLLDATGERLVRLDLEWAALGGDFRLLAAVLTGPGTGSIVEIGSGVLTGGNDFIGFHDIKLDDSLLQTLTGVAVALKLEAIE